MSPPPSEGAPSNAASKDGPRPDASLRGVSLRDVSLIVLGDYAWDVLIRTNTELLSGGDTYGEVMLAPGGSAANVAVWARRGGLPTTFIGKVGRDRFGGLAEEELAREGVERCLISTDAHLTGSVAVWIDHTGQRSMVSGKGADHYLLPSELPRERIEEATHLHLSAWSFFADPPRTAARRAAEWAGAAGATLSFDPGSFQMIDEMGVDAFLGATADMGVDLLFPNKEEGAILSGESDPPRIAVRLAELYAGATIALKLDALGAYVLQDGEGHHVPPATQNLVDATGAGDSFAGAFLARWLTSGDAVEAARHATRVSAWVIEHLGARPLPDTRLDTIQER